MVRIITTEKSPPLSKLRRSLVRFAARLDVYGDWSIRLTDDREIRDFNHRYRQKDAATDVLAFPCREMLPEGYYLGDVIVSLQRAKIQAAQNGCTLERELLLLMTHGLLHLAGYDHETDSGRMQQLQAQLLRRFPENWR